MGFRLSKRIYKIAEKAAGADSIADIGTDHGYVPMLLLKDGSVSFAIMSDISPDSLEKARNTFGISGLKAGPECFRVGNGLDTIRNGEVDTVIIAGLGGFTIIEILQNDIEKSKSFHRLVMQPRKHSGNLRYFLYTNGWDIIDESLAPEGKFVCEVITAVPSKDTFREAPYREDDIRWKYPAAIVQADKTLAEKRISWKITSIEEQIRNLERSRSDNSETISRLKEDRKYLMELIGRDK